MRGGVFKQLGDQFPANTASLAFRSADPSGADAQAGTTSAADLRHMYCLVYVTAKCGGSAWRLKEFFRRAMAFLHKLPRFRGKGPNGAQTSLGHVCGLLQVAQL